MSNKEKINRQHQEEVLGLHADMANIRREYERLQDLAVKIRTGYICQKALLASKSRIINRHRKGRLCRAMLRLRWQLRPRCNWPSEFCAISVSFDPLGPA